MNLAGYCIGAVAEQERRTSTMLNSLFAAKHTSREGEKLKIQKVTFLSILIRNKNDIHKNKHIKQKTQQKYKFPICTLHTVIDYGNAKNVIYSYFINQ